MDQLSVTALEFSELPTSLKAPSLGYALRHVCFIFASLYALSLAAYFAADAGYPWLIALILPLLGAQIYKVTIIMHDCCHGTMFRSRRWNNIVGTLGGYFLGTEFKSFTRVHWKHHSRYGEPDDPQGDDYLDLENASRRAIAWHLVRPLVGYNLSKLMVFQQARGAESETIAASWKSRLLFLAGTAAVQLTIAAAATGFFSIWWTALVYPAAAATFALFFSQTRGFAEHVANPSQSPKRYARTHLPNWIDRMFFYTLNFNYHIEHHKYPSVPSCHLPQIHDIMAETVAPNVSRSIASTVATRLRTAPADQ